MSRCTSTAKLRVLIVTGIFPPDIGGPATYVPALAAALLDRGHDVDVVTLGERSRRRCANDPFPVTSIRRALPKPIRMTLTVAALIRLGWNADLLFVNGLYLEAAVANAFLRLPLVQKWVCDWAWEHALQQKWLASSFASFQEQWSGWRAEWFKMLRNISARRADALITPSRYLGRIVAAWGVDASKITAIYNGVDQATVVPARLPLAANCQIATVGRLIAIKQVDRIIDAVTALDEAGLVIIGDGEERQRLEALAGERSLSDRIYFAGRKSRDETLALMAGCDLLVLNSTHEGLPHVVLEAMSLGVPVVATAVGGTPEVIQNGVNGLLIDAAASDELRDCLSWLMSAPEERKRLAEQGRLTAACFNRERMIEQTLTLLEATARGQQPKTERRRDNAVARSGEAPPAPRPAGA
jgi:glycosyltransferase involved in cell wall biosynthesis